VARGVDILKVAAETLLRTDSHRRQTYYKALGRKAAQGHVLLLGEQQGMLLCGFSAECRLGVYHPILSVLFRPSLVFGNVHKQLFDIQQRCIDYVCRVTSHNLIDVPKMNRPG
jgi:hypothetical protein